MDFDVKIEQYENYYGNADEVKKRINECPICTNKLVLSHQSDYKNFLIQETARCLDCGHSHRKTLYRIN